MHRTHVNKNEALRSQKGKVHIHITRLYKNGFVLGLS